MNRWIFWIGLVLSLSVLLVSFLFEWLSGVRPCFICQLQRLPYVAAIVGSVYGLIFRQSTFATSWLLLASLTSILLSGYHLLIQYGFLAEPCHVPNVVTIDDFNAILSNTTACSQKSWMFLGVPISAYNFLLSASGLTFLVKILLLSSAKRSDAIFIEKPEKFFTFQ